MKEVDNLNEKSMTIPENNISDDEIKNLLVARPFIFRKDLKRKGEKNCCHPSVNVIQGTKEELESVKKYEIRDIILVDDKKYKDLCKILLKYIKDSKPKKKDMICSDCLKKWFQTAPLLLKPYQDHFHTFLLYFLDWITSVLNNKNGKFLNEFLCTTLEWLCSEVKLLGEGNNSGLRILLDEEFANKYYKFVTKCPDNLSKYKDLSWNRYEKFLSLETFKLFDAITYEMTEKVNFYNKTKNNLLTFFNEKEKIILCDKSLVYTINHSFIIIKALNDVLATLKKDKNICENAKQWSLLETPVIVLLLSKEYKEIFSHSYILDHDNNDKLLTFMNNTLKTILNDDSYSSSYSEMYGYAKNFDESTMVSLIFLNRFEEMSKTKDNFMPADIHLIDCVKNVIDKESCTYETKHNINIQRIKFLWKHSDSSSELFYNIIFTVISDKWAYFQRGELLFFVGLFLHHKKVVKNNVKEYTKSICDLFCQAVNSTMEIGSLLVYYSDLKKYFAESEKELLEKMEKKLQLRFKMEKLFRKYFYGLKVDNNEMAKAERPFPYPFFSIFIQTFLMHTANEKIGRQRACIELFIDKLNENGTLRKIWLEGVVYSMAKNLMPFYKYVQKILESPLKHIPMDMINAICSGDWREVMAIRGKIQKFEEYKESEIKVIKSICVSGQARIELVKVPELPMPAIAKSFYKKQYTRLNNEITILLSTQCHPHLITIYGSIVNDHQIVGILMEYSKGGSLADFIKKSKNYSAINIYSWTAQAACGLNFLHRNGIFHRDVKPDNMLLNVNHRHLKINDLGIARVVPNISTNSRFSNNTTNLGTENYMAPEVKNDIMYNYSAKMDIYSLGRSIWHMIYRCEPTSDKVEATIISFSDPPSKSNLRPIIEDSEVWDFVKKMMETDPEERPSMEEVYNTFSHLLPENILLTEQDISRNNNFPLLTFYLCLVLLIISVVYLGISTYQCNGFFLYI